MVTKKHYVNTFNISKTFEGVSNTLQNFTFMGTKVSEIAEGSARLPSPPLVKGVGTKGFVKEGINRCQSLCQKGFVCMLIKLSYKACSSMWSSENGPLVLILPSYSQIFIFKHID